MVWNRTNAHARQLDGLGNMPTDKVFPLVKAKGECIFVVNRNEEMHTSTVATKLK